MAVPNVYSPLSVPAMFMIQRRQRLLRGVLARAFPQGVGDVSLLEIGCGNGQWLAEFVALGFAPGKLHGVELSAVRAAEAAARLPGVDARQGDASFLPWADGAFDIVFQSTVFTSIPDPAAKRRVAAEMRRVCRPGGLVVVVRLRLRQPQQPGGQGRQGQGSPGAFRPLEGADLESDAGPAHRPPARPVVLDGRRAPGDLLPLPPHPSARRH